MISKKANWAGSSLSTFRDVTVRLIIHPAGGQHLQRPLDLLTGTLGDDKYGRKLSIGRGFYNGQPKFFAAEKHANG